MRRLGTSLTVLAAALLAACSDRSPLPTAPSPAEPTAAPRIVALSPAVAVTLRDLGLEDRIVGRHGWDLVLDRSLPVCGDQSGINYESLLAARPTHVILEWGTRDLPARLVQLAVTHAWSVHTVRLLTLADIRAFTADAAAEFVPDDPHAAEVVASLDRIPDGVDRSGAGRVLLLLSASPPAALGTGSYHHEILSLLGGMHALDRGQPYVTLNAEDVLRLAPDGIVLIAPRSPGTEETGEPAWEEIAASLGRLASLPIPAIERRRVAVIDDPLALIPSTAAVGFAERLRTILDAWNEPTP
ncbi:MAG TPA: hypothetical protein PLU35_09105 [Phycisphaerales bacterium]|nr:hypothetical protein [Phycisphaerales bacterium]